MAEELRMRGDREKLAEAEAALAATRPRQPGIIRSRHHVKHAAKFSPRAIKRAMSDVEGFNAKLAVLITGGVGTMACAYAFAALALLSLPAAISTGQLIIIVAWIAQTFLQLVLLSIIMVGQRVQSAASDARASKEFADVETILDRLDVHTQGGLADVPAAVRDEVAKLLKPDLPPRP